MGGKDIKIDMREREREKREDITLETLFSWSPHGNTSVHLEADVKLRGWEGSVSCSEYQVQGYAFHSGATTEKAARLEIGR